LIRAVLERLGTHELAIVREGEFLHPLAAVYRTSLLPRLKDLLAAGKRRPLDLVNASDSLRIDVTDLRVADPELQSLRNLNTPEEYEAALRDARL
jgi:molybdopterin-guanine dinucleotide biosynthesis protein A